MSEWCVRCIQYGDRAYAMPGFDLCDECMADDAEHDEWIAATYPPEGDIDGLPTCS